MMAHTTISPTIAIQIAVKRIWKREPCAVGAA